MSPFERFAVRYEVGPELPLDDVRRRKIELIAEIGRAESIRDFGGLWGVDGLYLIEGARSLGASFAEMIDVTPREGFLVKAKELQDERAVQVNLVQADFRMPELYEVLRPVEVSLLYEVLLHQDPAVEVIKGVTATTSGVVCVAQPVLREELFRLPAGCVNLQFYDQELKDELREGSWWPEEVPAAGFETAKWMWGQTTSWIESVFEGYGWRVEYRDLSAQGPYWAFAMLRFVPATSPADSK